MFGLRVLALATLLFVLGGCSGATPMTGEPADGSAGAAALPRVMDLQDMIAHPEPYDGQVVTIAGEAVGGGADSDASGHVLIQAGPAVVSVWAPVALTRRIRHIGRRYVQGDKVRVTGVFQWADAAHGGEQDILAMDITVVESGGVLRPAYEEMRSALMAVAWFAAGVAFVVWRWRIRR